MTVQPIKGFGFALLAALLWSGAGFLVLRGYESGQDVSSLAGTLIRVVVNLGLVLLIHFIRQKEFKLPWGSGTFDLWLWGVLGAFTITSYFASLKEIGAGEATLLQGIQGIVIAILAPSILGQKTGWLSWVAVAGGLWGMFLIVGDKTGGVGQWQGRGLALTSGLCAGSAYLLLSRSRGRHLPRTISFYWCLLSLIVTGGLAIFSHTRIPTHGPALHWLIGAGVAGSFAQWLTTIAYRSAPAALVSATSYLVPVFSVGWECLRDQKSLDPRVAAGSALVLVSGMALPFLSLRGQPRTYG